MNTNFKRHTATMFEVPKRCFFPFFAVYFAYLPTKFAPFKYLGLFKAKTTEASSAITGSNYSSSREFKTPRRRRFFPLANGLLVAKPLVIGQRHSFNCTAKFFSICSHSWNSPVAPTNMHGRSPRRPWC